MPSQSTLLGAAGEHHVMTELLRRRYIAALAPHGMPNADIVVTDIEGSRLCAIQVKTRRAIGSDGGWHMAARKPDIAWRAAQGSRASSWRGSTEWNNGRTLNMAQANSTRSDGPPLGGGADDLPARGEELP